MKTFNNILVFYPLKIISLRSRYDRVWYFLNLRSRKDKFYMLWWFFQSLKKGVKSSLGKHMHLIDNINLIRRLGWLKLSTFNHIPYIIDSSIGSSIDFYDIKKLPIVGIQAVLTHPTRISIPCECQAIDPLRKYACHGRFARSSGSMKQIGSNGTILQKSILQDLSHKSLSENRTKIFGSICLVECHYRRKKEERYIRAVYLYSRKNKI